MEIYVRVGITLHFVISRPYNQSQFYVFTSLADANVVAETCSITNWDRDYRLAAEKDSTKAIFINIVKNQIVKV